MALKLSTPRPASTAMAKGRIAARRREPEEVGARNSARKVSARAVQPSIEGAKRPTGGRAWTEAMPHASAASQGAWRAGASNQRKAKTLAHRAKAAPQRIAS